MLGLLDAASYEESGKKEAYPNFPYRLIFHPTKYAHELFKDA